MIAFAAAVGMGTTMLVGVYLMRSAFDKRGEFSPLAGTMLAWSGVIALYLWNPIGLTPIRPATWALICCALTTYTIGYATVAAWDKAAIRRANVAVELAVPRTVTRLWTVTAAVAAALLALFLSQTVPTYGQSNLGSYLLNLRLSLGEGRVPLGFYYFYFAELLVPFSYLLSRRLPNRRWLFRAVAIVALLALLLTSARTNASKALLWTGVAWLIDPLRPRLRMRMAARAVVGVITGLVIFTLLGDLIGKSYENSSLAADQSVHSSRGIPAELALPYLYVVGPLPTLDQVVHEDTYATARDSGGAAVLRPVLQVLERVVPGVTAPAQQQAFRYIPYPFNTATFIGPVFSDWGLQGVVVVVFALGVVGGWAQIRWRRDRSLANQLLLSLIVVSAITSTGDLSLNGLSYLLQIALLLYAGRRSRTQSRRRFKESAAL